MVYYLASITDGDTMQDNPQEALIMSYVAGLMDGEGSFCIAKQPKKYEDGRQNDYHHPCVRIGMTDGNVITWLHTLFGVGNWYNEGVRKDRPTYKVMYRWDVRKRDEVIVVIERLLPYLRVKKRQAELVLKFCKEWKNAMVRYYRQDPSTLQAREEIYQEVRKLNGVGAPAETEYRGPETASDSPILQEIVGG